jgi:hypothetical protein
MSENIPGFKPELEGPFRFRAFHELEKMLPALKQKQREVVTIPEDIEDLNDGWSLILFTEKKFLLELPTLGSDTSALTWIQYPKADDPLIEVSFETYYKDEPVTENDATGFPINGYTAFFGPELEPFIIHNTQLEIYINQPLGEQIADLPCKRKPTDKECEAIVNLVALNIDEVSDKISE